MFRRLSVLVLSAVLACATGRPPPPPTGSDDAAARQVLGRFARAVRMGRWEEADALLSARWRATHGPGRLALDARGAGPAAGEAAARVVGALDAGVALERAPGAARLSVGAGRAAVVVLEPQGWRVDALE
ncbi:MAG TPA: hypothetical protein VF875_17405 [Anaeromyxobacter sp.]